MSIESSRAATSHKPMGGVDHRGGKKAVMADLATGDASGGFAMLMGLLSASDGTTDSPMVASAADGGSMGSTPSASLNNDTNLPLAQSGYALAAMKVDATAGSGVPQLAQVARQSADISGLTRDANGGFQRGPSLAVQASSPARADTMAQQPQQVTKPLADISGLTLDAKGGFQRGPALAAMLGNPSDTQSNSRAAMVQTTLAATNMQASSTPLGDGAAQPAAPWADISGLTLDANAGFQRGHALAAMLGNPPDKQSPGLVAMAQVSPAAQASSPALDANAGFQRGPALAAMLGNSQDNQLKDIPTLADSALTAINSKAPTAVVTSGVALQASPLVNSNATLTVLADAVSRGDAGQVMPTDTQPGPKSVSHVPTLSAAAQAEQRDARAHPSTVDLAARTEVGSPLALMNGAADSLLGAQERTVVRSPLARTGDTSGGAFGVTAGVNARADAPYAIEATAAAVPDTAIAETVSYWATQGVQNAELTLDGFGSDPVEVSISLNGDQAQVDFRTDQADVRQALEAATAELRDLLSGEGLQLAGVSVGSSGSRSAQGEAQQSGAGVKQEVLTQESSPVATAVRSSNPSVGRSLDLFV